MPPKKYTYSAQDPWKVLQDRLDELDKRMQQVEPGLYPEPWHYVGGLGEPAYENAWVNNGAPYFQFGFMMNHGGMVHFGGSIKTGVSGTSVFTLPPLYRPSSQTIVIITAISTGFGSAIIGTNGVVTAYGTPPFCFDGAIFRIV